jgi:glutamate-1-semialdehyde 2,1-aminomutase
MAVRLSRSVTGKPKVVRFLTHFHGWHDHMTSGHANHFDGTPTAGVLAGIAEHVILLPPGDVEAVKHIFASRNDIACVILEPTGTSFGAAPLPPSFLHMLREETEKHGILLIFDEVVTGFRVSPGGAQGEFGIKPDLTSLAKILAGGLPGGAVVGRRDILDDLDFDAAERKKREKIAHPGTYNANPLSAAAGIAALEIVGTGEPCKQASATAASLRAALNDVLAEERVPWAVHGSFSGFHFFLNPKQRPIDPHRFDPTALDYKELLSNPPALARLIRLALLANGVDVNGRISGFTSAAHGKAEVEETARALRQSLRMLRAEGELPGA